MTILDITAGKVIATMPIGENNNGNGFDAGTGFVFSSNGYGTLTRKYLPYRVESRVSIGSNGRPASGAFHVFARFLMK